MFGYNTYLESLDAIIQHDGMSAERGKIADDVSASGPQSVRTCSFTAVKRKNPTPLPVLIILQSAVCNLQSASLQSANVRHRI